MARGVWRDVEESLPTRGEGNQKNHEAHNAVDCLSLDVP